MNIVEVLFFTLNGCAPCEQVKPVVQAARRYDNVIYSEKQFDRDRQDFIDYNVSGTPTVIVKANQSVFRVFNNPDDIEDDFIDTINQLTVYQTPVSSGTDTNNMDTNTNSKKSGFGLFGTIAFGVVLYQIFKPSSNE